MYIDATSVGAVDRRFEREVVRMIRAAMHAYELEVERIQVQISWKPAGHVCRLHAWAERAQTVVIECRASSRLGAIETATESLKRAVANRTCRRLAAAVPPAQHPAPAAPAVTGPGGIERARKRGSGAGRGSSPQRRRVLLALQELDPSSACLQWVRALASSLESDIDVCRALPKFPPTNGLQGGRAWLDATRRLLDATRATRHWCADALPEAELSERPIPAAADIVEEAALRARERPVDWIVMPHVRKGCGRLATALARASGCPVLVAREATSRSTLLVVTDASEDLYPVCSRAAALAQALHAPVLAFHDAGFRAPELGSRVNALTETWARIQSERLDAGSQRLCELEVLVASGTDRVETILQQARCEDAELIIVGLSAEPGGAGAEVPEEVVDRSIGSVLVVPSPMPRSMPRRRSPEDPEHHHPLWSGRAERRSRPTLD